MVTVETIIPEVKKTRRVNRPFIGGSDSNPDQDFCEASSLLSDQNQKNRKTTSLSSLNMKIDAKNPLSTTMDYSMGWKGDNSMKNNNNSRGKPVRYVSSISSTQQNNFSTNRQNQ